LSEQTKEFGLFIDGLRIDRHLSREDLCSGIISISQYKRYLNGSTSIPNDKLIKLADRLNFSISEIHSLFQSKYNNQYRKILEIYNLIKRRNYEEAYKKAIELSKLPILSSYNNLLFDYCMIKIQYELDQASSIQALDSFSNLINYPECQNNETFNWVEINILNEIVIISSKLENYEPANVLFNILTSTHITQSSSEDRFFMPTTYAILSQLLGKQEKYEQVVKLTESGIKYSLYHDISNALSNLFLTNAYANLDLGNVDQAKISARKAFAQLYIENKPEKYNQFKLNFEKEFDMSVSELMKTDW
jgi:transcriptional regulator with XRE-family HTH domain